MINIIYRTNNANNTNPSFLSTSFCDFAKIAPSIVIAVMKAISAIISGSIGIGIITLLIPRIKRMLKMHEPSTLPMTMPFSPFLSAVIEVTSSGREVPIATTVRPISASLKSCFSHFFTNRFRMFL